MKRLVCLLYAIGILGCGVAEPSMPPYAGTVNGVRYYIDHDIDLTLEQASVFVEANVAAWGEDMDRVKDLGVGFTTRSFNCGSIAGRVGCYVKHMGDSNIFLLVRNACPYNVPLIHELWHYLYSPTQEPSYTGEDQPPLITQQALTLEMAERFGNCGLFDNTTPITP